MLDNPNGGREMVGELRGEISAVIRGMAEIREELQGDRHRIEDKLDKLGRQMEAHLALHKAEDTFRLQRREQQQDNRERQQNITISRRHTSDRFDRYLGYGLGACAGALIPAALHWIHVI